MYLLVFFGMVQHGLLITLLFRLEQNHSSECKSSPLTLPLMRLSSAPLRLLLFSSSSCDTCSVIIKVIFYIWTRGKWQAANPATGAFISAFQLPYNLVRAFAEMQGKSCSVSINHVSRKSEIWPVQVCQPPAMRAPLAGNQSRCSPVSLSGHGERRCTFAWTLQDLHLKKKNTWECGNVRFMPKALHILMKATIREQFTRWTEIFIIYSNSCCSIHKTYILS